MLSREIAITLVGRCPIKLNTAFPLKRVYIITRDEEQTVITANEG